MNLSSFKIGTQLKIGFAILLFMVVLLGLVSYFQTQKLHQKTELLFNHPFQVITFISKIENYILNMDVASRELMETSDLSARLKALQNMELAATAAFQQLDIVSSRYLGSPLDVERAKNAFVIYRSSLQNEMRAVTNFGNKTIDRVRILALRDDLFAKLSIIENFANNKANTSFSEFQKLEKDLKIKLLLLVFFIIVFSLIVNAVLLRRIQKPLKILTKATHDFRHGDLNARSDYHLSNEFGLLSDSYNRLANRIQLEIQLNEKKTTLSTSMLIENDARSFFHSTLSALLTLTNAQMAALYVWSEAENQLELYESIGLQQNLKKFFDPSVLEGEMGNVLATKKIQHFQTINTDQPFVFETVYGNIKPREFMAIPLLSGKRVIATIHLATINTFDKQSKLLIESFLETLSARVDGILAYQKIKDFSEKMEFQNRELEMQKSELSKQSETLQHQNTELEVQKRELDEVNRLKTIFLSNMSHELRTPLNSVIALSGVLNRRLAHKIPADEYSYLEVIERNGKHLLSLINDILDLSRIEAGREDIEIMSFDANELISDIVELIKPQAQEKGIELIFNADEKSINLNSDLKKCRHILQNIVGNAVKFTEKGFVEIQVKKMGNHLQFEVSDTGIGISTSQQQHIFEEFRQADNSTSRRFGGTGLGLSIAKKYAELLGGSIQVKSKPGKGSLFTITIPIDCEGERTESINNPFKKGSHSHLDASQTEGKTILLVDDSEPAIIQLCDVLQDSGYQIQIARNGEEAIERIGEVVPQAMILDLMMPVMDGFDVLKTLREENRTAHVPVLILTAKHITKEELRFLKRNNIHQLVQKGDINRNDLLKSIQEMTQIVTKTNEETE